MTTSQADAQNLINYVLEMADYVIRLYSTMKHGIADDFSQNCPLPEDTKSLVRSVVEESYEALPDVLEIMLIHINRIQFLRDYLKEYYRAHQATIMSSNRFFYGFCIAHFVFASQLVERGFGEAIDITAGTINDLCYVRCGYKELNSLD